MYVNRVFYKLLFQDPRVENMFLMNSFVPSAAICIIYVVFVFVGPIYMKNREPCSLKSIIKYYNLFASLSSGYIFYEVWKYILFTF
jgi:elongation of very long chain fatty acids protein 4